MKLKFKEKIVEYISYLQHNIYLTRCEIRTKQIMEQLGESVGNNFRIYGILHMNCVGKISIGDNVTINSGALFNPTVGNAETYMVVQKNGELVIGNNVGISNSSISVYERVEIQDDVAIGAGCVIFDTDFHSKNYDDRITNGNINAVTTPILIKRGAFIGANSIILKGVTIGEYAVIGAGTVVTKNIPNGEIWAGNPCEKIGEVC